MSRAKYRHSLPQLSDRLFLTDGGIETTLIFLERHRAALLRGLRPAQDREGRPRAQRLFHALRRRSRVDARHRLRAGKPDVARQRGLGRQARLLRRRARRDQPQIDRADGRAARPARNAANSPIVISGCVGPRGDGYDPGRDDERGRSRGLSRRPDRDLRETEADMVTAFTMTNANEAIGVAARRRGRGHAGRDLVHGRDRRPPADRADAAGRDRRRSTRRPARRRPTT